MQVADDAEKVVAWFVLVVIALAVAIAAYRYRRLARQFVIGVVGGLVLGFAALFGISALIWAVMTVLR